MNIATKVTLVVLVLAGLLLFGAAQTALQLHEQTGVDAISQQGRVLAGALRLAAEQDLANHGRLGTLVDLVGRQAGQRLVFYDASGRAVAPVPTDEDPSPHARIRNLIIAGQAKDIVIGSGELATYIHRTPIHGRSGRAVGAMELTISVAATWQRSAQLKGGLMVVGILLLLFALAFGAYAHRAIGRPIAQLMEGMEAVIHGDLTHALPLDRNDEVGRIAYQFNEMTGRLRAALDEIQDNAETKLRLESSLRRSEKLATIGQLSAEIAHELGTPLNVIGGRARALRRKAQSPQDVVKNAEIINAQVTRITKIIQQVLDLSRAPTRHHEATDLRKLIKEAVSFLTPQAEQAKVRVIFNAPKDLPLVDGNADALQQVALNLMLNGIQAMPKGGALRVELEVSHRRKGGLDLAPPQSFVAIVVEDSGVGIPEAQRSQVFDPFFTTKARGEGTGLGLTVVVGIVKEHDGWVEISDGAKGGCVFRVFLPLGTGSGEDKGQRTSRRGVGPGDNERSGVARLPAAPIVRTLTGPTMPSPDPDARTEPKDDGEP